MATIYESYNANLLATRWEETVNDREPYLLQAFFTEIKQLGLELSFLQGNAPKVRPLDLSAFDVKALPISREAFNKITTEMPFFKNSLNINEKTRQELLKAIQTGNKKYIDVIVNKIYNDNKTLLDDASVTREMMRAMILTTGTIVFASNGQAVSYDFGVPSTNKKTLSGTAKWDAPETADPISDIIEWQDTVENATGARPTNLLMNRKTFNLMKKCASVKNAIYILANGKVSPNDARLKEYIMEETGCTVYVYDKGYHAQGATSLTKFVSDNVVSLFTDGAMGEFVFGTTPEEADLMSGVATDAEVEIVDLGVAITTIKEKDPVNVMTKVSMIGMPTLEKPNQLFIATVA